MGNNKPRFRFRTLDRNISAEICGYLLLIYDTDKKILAHIVTYKTKVLLIFEKYGQDGL